MKKMLLLFSVFYLCTNSYVDARVHYNQDTGNYYDDEIKSERRKEREDLEQLKNYKTMGRYMTQGAVDEIKNTLGSLPKMNFGVEDGMRQLSQEIFSGAREALKHDPQGVIQDRVNRGMDRVVFRNMIKGGAIFVGFSAALIIVGNGLHLTFKMIERMLTRPKLIIEWSKKSRVQTITSLFTSVRQSLPMVFSAALKEQLENIVKVTRVVNNKIKKGFTNVKYRNLMLYGPPGTGKTMFAKELAKRCGLEYVFMSGSSFSKFKDGEGIEALDELFAWAKRSKGLLIFIDEAETFLSKRENMDPQSKAYQLLNNFLNYTGDRSSQFMIVFATNHKDALDSAMYRRIDDLIEMPLPSKEQRVGTLKLYINKILMDVKQNGKVFVDSVVQYFDGQMIDDIAQKTKGLSYGDLEGIINTIKTDSDILDPSVVSVALINTVVERAVKKHQAFTQGQALGFVED